MNMVPPPLSSSDSSPFGTVTFKRTRSLCEPERRVKQALEVLKDMPLDDVINLWFDAQSEDGLSPINANSIMQVHEAESMRPPNHAGLSVEPSAPLSSTSGGQLSMPPPRHRPRFGTKTIRIKQNRESTASTSSASSDNVSSIFSPAAVSPHSMSTFRDSIASLPSTPLTEVLEKPEELSTNKDSQLQHAIFRSGVNIAETEVDYISNEKPKVHSPDYDTHPSTNGLSNARSWLELDSPRTSLIRGWTDTSSNAAIGATSGRVSLGEELSSHVSSKQNSGSKTSRPSSDMQASQSIPQGLEVLSCEGDDQAAHESECSRPLKRAAAEKKSPTSICVCCFPDCDRVFLRKYDYKRHYMDCHERDYVYVCTFDDCNHKTFSSPTRWSRHQNKHSFCVPNCQDRLQELHTCNIRRSAKECAIPNQKKEKSRRGCGKCEFSAETLDAWLEHTALHCETAFNRYCETALSTQKWHQPWNAFSRDEQERLAKQWAVQYREEKWDTGLVIYNLLQSKDLEQARIELRLERLPRDGWSARAAEELQHRLEQQKESPQALFIDAVDTYYPGLFDGTHTSHGIKSTSVEGQFVNDDLSQNPQHFPQYRDTRLNPQSNTPLYIGNYIQRSQPDFPDVDQHQRETKNGHLVPHSALIRYQENGSGIRLPHNSHQTTLPAQSGQNSARVSAQHPNSSHLSTQPSQQSYPTQYQHRASHPPESLLAQQQRFIVSSTTRQLDEIAPNYHPAYPSMHQ